jgi:hypothetical protein
LLPADPPEAAPAVGVAPPLPLGAPELPAVDDVLPENAFEPALELVLPPEEVPATPEGAPAVGVPGAPPETAPLVESLPQAEIAMGKAAAKNQ